MGLDIAHEVLRFQERCRRFRDESQTGSIALTVKFMDGQPASAQLRHATHRVMNLPEIQPENPLGTAQSLWRELKDEDRRFFGEISIEWMFFRGRVVDCRDSAARNTRTGQ